MISLLWALGLQRQSQPAGPSSRMAVCPSTIEFRASWHSLRDAESARLLRVGFCGILGFFIILILYLGVRGGGEEGILSDFRVLLVPQSCVQHLLAVCLSTVVEVVWKVALFFTWDFTHIYLGWGDFHLCGCVSHLSASPGPSYSASTVVCPSL